MRTRRISKNVSILMNLTRCVIALMMSRREIKDDIFELDLGSNKF